MHEQTRKLRRHTPTGATRTRRLPRAASGRAPGRDIGGVGTTAAPRQKVGCQEGIASRPPRRERRYQTTTGASGSDCSRPGARHRWCRNSDAAQQAQGLLPRKAVSVAPRGAIGRAPGSDAGGAGAATGRRHKASCHQGGVSDIGRGPGRGAGGVGTTAAPRHKASCHARRCQSHPEARLVAPRGATQVASEQQRLAGTRRVATKAVSVALRGTI